METSKKILSDVKKELLQFKYHMEKYNADFEKTVRSMIYKNFKEKDYGKEWKYTLVALLETDILKWVEKKYPDIYDEWILHLKNTINKKLK